MNTNDHFIYLLFGIIETGGQTEKGENNIIVSSTSDNQPGLTAHRHNLNLRNRNCESVKSIERSRSTPTERSRALMVRKEPAPKLIKASKELLAERTMVLAQMRTFAAWPAHILSFGKTYVDVYFYGDGTTGHVPYENVGLFQNNHRLIRFNLSKKINGYERAVVCAERVLKVPHHLSIVNVN